jgi:excinuclease ABC subunit B
MARQGDVEREAGRYGSKGPRGGSRISKPDLDNMGPGTDRELPADTPLWQERPKPRSTQGLGGQRPKYKGGGGRKRG